MILLLQSRVANITVGDHIAKINGTDLTGCRHFEVARMLKEIPIGSEFTMICVEPKKSFGKASIPCPLQLCQACCVQYCVPAWLG